MKKPTAEQAAWVVSKVRKAMEVGASFRYFYQNLMGYPPEEYERFLKAGGMELTNAFCIVRDSKAE